MTARKALAIPTWNVLQRVANLAEVNLVVLKVESVSGGVLARILVKHLTAADGSKLVVKLNQNHVPAHPEITTNSIVTIASIGNAPTAIG